MKLKVTIIILGLCSIFLAYIPYYSKIFTLVGFTMSVIGLVLVKMKKDYSKGLRLGGTICTISIVISSLMLMYNWTT